MATARERARIVYGGSTTSGMDSLGVGAGSAQGSPFRFGGSGMFKAGGASIGGETEAAPMAASTTNNYYGADSSGSNYMGQSTWSGGGSSGGGFGGGYAGGGAINRSSGGYTLGSGGNFTNTATGIKSRDLPEGYTTRPSTVVKPAVKGIPNQSRFQQWEKDKMPTGKPKNDPSPYGNTNSSLNNKPLNPNRPDRTGLPTSAIGAGGKIISDGGAGGRRADQGHLAQGPRISTVSTEDYIKNQTATGNDRATGAGGIRWN